MFCPNLTSPEWKALVQKIGEDNAWREFLTHGRIPEADRYVLLDSEDKQSLFYSIRTKSTEEISKTLDPTIFKSQEEIKYGRFIQAAVISRLGDISPGKKLEVKPSEAFDSVRATYADVASSLNMVLDDIDSEQAYQELKASPQYSEILEQFPVLNYVGSHADIVKAANTYNKLITDFDKYRDFVIAEMAHKGIRLTSNKVEAIDRQEADDKDQDETEEVEIANVEVGERFDKSIFETNPRNTASVRIKAMLETIKTGSYELGIPVYANPEDVLADVLHAGSVIALTGFTTAATKLQAFKVAITMRKDSRPYLDDLLGKVLEMEQKGQWDKINDLLTFATKAFANETLLLYKTRRQGDKVTSVSDVKVINSNRDTIEEQVSRDWVAQHMTGDFFQKSATGELKPDPEKVKRLAQIIEEGRATKVHDEKVAKFREFFQVLGIQFTDNDLQQIVPKLAGALKKGKAGFEIVFTAKNMLENIQKSYEANLDQPFLGNYGFQDEKSSMYKLAALYYDANPGKYNITSARTADGKSKYLYILPNYAENKKREWESGNSTPLLNSALAQPNKDFWNQVKNGTKTFRLGYFNGIREQETGRDGKVRKALTDKEQTVSMFLKHQESIAAGSYIIFTLSDKTTTIETKVSREFFVDDPTNEIPMGLGTDYVIEEGNIVYTDNIKDKVYNNFVAPEISRILAAIKHEENVKLEGFATASRIFYFLPNLNADARLQEFRDDLYSGMPASELQAKHGKLVADVVLEFFNKSAERQLTNLVKSGVIEETNGNYSFPVFNDGFKKGSYVQKFRATGAKGKNLAMLMLMDMKLNYMNAQVKTIQFLRFDPMLAFKANKTVDKKKGFNELTGVEKVKHALSTWDEFSKRAASLIAPGSQGNWSWKWDNNTKEYASYTYNAVTLEDVEIDINGIGNTTTDAQEFVTMQEHIDYLMQEGKLPLEVWESIHKKIEGAKSRPDRYYELDEKELSLVFNPVKPVMVHDASEGENTGLNRVDYIKSSRFPLIPQHEAGSERDKLRVWMEKNNIQSANFASGKKLGRPTKSLKVFSEDGSFIEPTAEDMALASQVLSRDGLRNQQEVPHQKSHIATVTQMNRTLFDGLLEEEFTVSGLKLKGTEAKTLKEAVRSRMFEINARKMKSRLGDLSKTHEGLYEVLKDVILNDTTGSYGENDLRSLALGADGKFKIPLEFQFKSKKFQGLVNSLINKNVMLKVDGASFIQVSGVGAKFNFSQLSKGAKSGIIWTDKYAKNFGADKSAKLEYIKKEGDTVTPAQVLVSQYLRDKEDNLIDLSQYITEKDGIKVLDTSRFTEEMFQLVGTRIPNQSHPSMLPIEVVGFLPSYMENTIVVPDGITGQMGSDFDVDKLYAYMSKMVAVYKESEKIASLMQDIEDNHALLEREYDDLKYLNDKRKETRSLYKERLTELKGRRSELKEQMEKSMKGEKKAALYDELQAVNEELDGIFESMAGLYSEIDLSKTAVSDIKGRIRAAKKDIKALQTEDQVERYTPVSYELNQMSDVDNLSKDQLEQLYRDIHWSVLTHSAAYDKITKSIDMPEVKKKVERRGKLLDKYGIVKEEDVVLPLDYQTSIDRFNDNRSGKDGVAVFANFISAQADLQDKPLRLGAVIQGVEEEDPLVMRLKRGATPTSLLYLGKTGESTSFLGEKRNISENLNMMFTESVDNAKNQYLREFNWDKKAMSPVGSLAMLTDKQGQAIPIEFAMDLTSQPVVRQLFGLIDQKQDSFGRFDTDAFGSAVVDLTNTIEKAIQGYLPAGQLAAAYLSDDSRDDILDPETLEEMWLVGEARNNPEALKKIAKDLGYDNTDALLLKYYTVQFDALNFFSRIDGIGRELMTILGGTYIYTKGIGPDAFNTKQKLNQLNKLSSSNVFLDIQNIAGEVVKTDSGQIQIDPKGEVGASILHSLIEAQSIYNQIFPITSGKELEGLVDMLLNGVGQNKDQLGKERYINAYSDVFNAVKSYMYTAPELGLFDDVRAVRNRLINGDTSIGKRVADLKGDAELSKNGFLKNIEVKKQWNGEAYTISFKAPFGTDIDEKAVLSGFYDLALSDREEIRELARDLALYPFATGDAGNIGRFIPIDYYMADEDFNRSIRHLADIYATHMMSGLNHGVIIDQIVQNNADVYSKKFAFHTSQGSSGTSNSAFKNILKPLIGNVDDLSKVSAFNIKLGDIKLNDKNQNILNAFKLPLNRQEMEDAEKRGIALPQEPFKYPPYVVITDSFASDFEGVEERNVKYLYKRVTPAVTEDGMARYQRIEILGHGSIKEYDYNNPSMTSVIKENNAINDEAPEVKPDGPIAPAAPVSAPVVQEGPLAPFQYTNHSGGAALSDTEWDQIGREFGVTDHRHYREPASERTGDSKSGDLDSAKLRKQGIKSVDLEESTHPGVYEEGKSKATLAGRQLGRLEDTHNARSNYIIRNWAQVKYADAVYALGTIIDAGTEMNYGKKAKIKQVKGGTGYAVQMAINEGKPVYVFDATKEGWYTWDKEQNDFVPTETPKLTRNFAGIGSRSLSTNEVIQKSLQAIRDVYAKTFGQPVDEKAQADNLPPIEQNFADGSKFKDSDGVWKTRNMQPQFKGKSTMDLILSGDRTRTTRAKSDINRMMADYGLSKIEDLVGKVIRMTDKSGRVAYTRITKVAPFTQEYQDQTWQKEGWEKSVTDRHVGDYPYAIEFELVDKPAASAGTVVTNRTYEGLINELSENQVFVFGSNPLGINGNPEKGTGGAALAANKKGWVKQGEKMDNRLSESGKAWGITTVAAPGKKRSKSPDDIKRGINTLYQYAAAHPEKEFLVAYQGTGTNLNGYSNQELADMFSSFEIPSNIVFEKEFATLLNSKKEEEEEKPATTVTIDSGTFIVEGSAEEGHEIFYAKADGSKGAKVINPAIIAKVATQAEADQHPQSVVTLDNIQGSPKYLVTLEGNVVSLNPTSFGKMITSESVVKAVMNKLTAAQEVVDNKTKEEKKEQPLMRNGKIVKVPEGSNPNNNVIFEDKEFAYLMNDGQQQAFDFIKGEVERLLKERKTLTVTDLDATVSFTDPLTQKFNGLIPKAMWDNMIGLAGRGGVGKTTVIKAIIAAIEGKNKYSQPSVMYLAPTHTAATVLQESLGLDSEKANDGTVNTISSHLRKNVPVGDKLLLSSEDDYVQSCKYKPSFGTPDIIIVDESSMVGAQDIKDMITRLKTDLTQTKDRGQLIHRMPIFIFMGDYRQLGPINEQQNQYVNKGVISASLLLDKTKTRELTQVMRSDDQLLHQIYDSIGNEIVDNINRTRSGQPARELSFANYDKLTSQSSENILVVNNVDGVIDDYTTYLAENNNPYGMFWVHYNNVQNPKTKNLAEKIRASYFNKIGLPIAVTPWRTFAKGDYIEFEGSLEIGSDEVTYTASDEKVEQMMEGKKMRRSENGAFRIPQGVIKPRSRFKVLDIVQGERYLSDFLPKALANMIDSTVKVNVEDVVLYNRQNRVRALTKILGLQVTMGSYNSRTKQQEGIQIVEKSTGRVLAKFNLQYWQFKEMQGALNKLNDKGTMPFVPSYIGSSHTAQGNSIKNVIVGDYNVKEARANTQINQDDIFSSMYTSLTRTSGTLTIIKPGSAPIVNNQDVFLGAITDDRKTLKPVSAVKPAGSVQITPMPIIDIVTPSPAAAGEEMDILNMILQAQNQDAATDLATELFGGKKEVNDYKGFLNKMFKVANPLNKQILTMIGKTGAIAPVRFVLDYSQADPGTYDNMTKTITINPKLAVGEGFADIKDAEARLHEVIMHELLHHVTVDMLQADPESLTAEQRKWVKSLKNLFSDVQTKLLADPNHGEKLRNAIAQTQKTDGYLSAADKSQYYGLTNVYDFAAMLMTDKGFQEFMNNVEYTGEKSILDRFLDILTGILQALGIEVKNNRVLKEGVQNIVGLITSRSEGTVQKSISVKEDLVKDHFAEIIQTLNIKTKC